MKAKPITSHFSEGLSKFIGAIIHWLIDHYQFLRKTQKYGHSFSLQKKASIIRAFVFSCCSFLAKHRVFVCLFFLSLPWVCDHPSEHNCDYDLVWHFCCLAENLLHTCTLKLQYNWWVPCYPLIKVPLNPFTARVNEWSLVRRGCNFWVCGRNPMMWPF